MAIEELPSKIETLLKTAPKERVLLTHNGQPFAFVSDASKYDWEDIGYMTGSKFWEMIRQRRESDEVIPFEQVEMEVATREKTQQPRKASKKRNRKSGLTKGSN
jgi:hypothetical protein